MSFCLFHKKYNKITSGIKRMFETSERYIPSEGKTFSFFTQLCFFLFVYIHGNPTTRTIGRFFFFA